MSVLLKYDSSLGAGSEQFVERRYLVSGSGSDSAAYSELLADASCPDTLTMPFGVVVRSSLRVSHVGNDLYECDARWGTPSTFDPSFVNVSFSTLGGQQKITQSKGTTRYPATAGGGLQAAPDHYGQIGVTKNGVEGVEIYVPSFQWSETHIISNSVATSAYRRTLVGMTAKVNNASFRDHAAGEAIFLGADGQRVSLDNWSITYHFAGSPNATGLSVGPITGIAKKGWQYLWVRHASEEDSTNNFVIQAPKGVYVETVYETADFSAIGI